MHVDFMFALHAVIVHHRSRLESIIRSAITWLTTVRTQYIAADYDLFFPSPGAAFDEDTMTQETATEDDDFVPTGTPGVVVVATLCPGVKAEVVESGTFKRTTTVLVKPYVVLDCPLPST